MAALVGTYPGIAAFDCVDLRRHVGGSAKVDVPVIHIVGSSHEYSGHWPRRILWPVDVKLHADSIAHRYHDLSLDHGDRLQHFLK